MTPTTNPYPLLSPWESYRTLSRDSLASELSDANYSDGTSTGVPDEADDIFKSIGLDEIFGRVQIVLGFQPDAAINAREFLKSQILSRAPRLNDSVKDAIKSLHVDYIAGKYANYRQWYLSAALRHPEDSQGNVNDVEAVSPERLIKRRFRSKYKKIKTAEKIQQLGIYLCLLVESSNLRLMPELMCYMFKTAHEYISNANPENPTKMAPSYYLEVLKPLYRYHCEQINHNVNNTLVKREADHDRTVTYDDINETFWMAERINTITLMDGRKLVDIPEEHRWAALDGVDWEKSLRKTFKETRAYAWHLLVNYTRLLALLGGFFWVFLSSIMVNIIWLNPGQPWRTRVGLDVYVLTDFEYEHAHDDAKRAVPATVLWTFIGLGGATGVFTCVVGAMAEFGFIPATMRNIKILLRRFLIYFAMLCACIAPAVHLLFVDHATFLAKILTAVTVLINATCLAVVVVVPPTTLVKNKIDNPTFIRNFAPITRQQRLYSIVLWSLLFIAKFIESYFVLFDAVTLAMEALWNLNPNTCAVGGWITCYVVSKIAVLLLIVMLGMFFYLDSYVWWLILTSVLQLSISSFRLFGLVWWERTFAHLPEKLFPRVFAIKDLPSVYRADPQVLCAELWNAIVQSLYDDHLINSDQKERISFHKIESMSLSKKGSESNLSSSPGIAPLDNIHAANRMHQTPSVSSTKALSMHSSDVETLSPSTLAYAKPEYLAALGNGATKMKFFPENSEAERRLKFFAHTLDMQFPVAMSVESTPALSVLIPHYNEKILLDFKEITTQEPESSFTVLEYLQSLHGSEWENFADECRKLIEAEKALDDDSDTKFGETTKSSFGDDSGSIFTDRIPASIRPELLLRTRKWASRRSQTLYRTISGMFQYATALKLLFRIENPAFCGSFSPANLERELDRLISLKLRVVVDMQRYQQFSETEMEDVNLLLKEFPALNIVWPEQVTDENGNQRFYTNMFDGYCEVLANGRRASKYRIELPGWPILGDGKGCNQNLGVMYTRGEFIQVIDANMDHYLEECIKVRSILAEFGELSVVPNNPPVALVGLREHIFTHGIGAVADMGATTETTLVSMNQPVLSKIGARLHYGHPDFWNAVFMLPRGCLSKAQRGLHLNEDIYAGMAALMRGGVNKHAEYMQVGKGKDLGFNSVLAYFSKLAMGMSEQMLSREQYRLGQQLPLDRLFSFFYANPGFVLSHTFAIASMQSFIIFLLCIAALSNTLVVCPQKPILGDWTVDMSKIVSDPPPDNCAHMEPIKDWLGTIVIAFLPVYAVIILPIAAHTVIERGKSAFWRFVRQLASLSIFFSIFGTMIWCRVFLSTANYGQARYVSTGRSLELVRKPFHTIFANYSDLALKAGLLMLACVLYVTTSEIVTPAISFFWITTVPLIISPFWFNPHQFRLDEFMQDYGRTLRWFRTGNSRTDDPDASSWIAYHRNLRRSITGNLRRLRYGVQSKDHRRRARRTVIWMHEIVVPLLVAIVGICAYAVGTAGGIERAVFLVGLTFVPLLVNAVVLVAVHAVCVIIGPMVGTVHRDGIGPVAATIGHLSSLASFIVVLGGIWLLSNWEFREALLGMIVFQLVLRFILRIFTLLLFRDVDETNTNLAWWDGRWYMTSSRWSQLAFSTRLFAPLREYPCKILEMCCWANDFMVAHILMFVLFPACCVPYMDRLQTFMVLWAPTGKASARIPSINRSTQGPRRTLPWWSSTLFLASFIIFIAILIVPTVFDWGFGVDNLPKLGISLGN
ncbi:1,3-beta-glucan synthase component-domain-containing protein [Gaertneriomyces semiglobifer]|nr:1,3-beta-glucan synthase component-domain-containing protein [Gaertneriomyces semiglobifer]